MNTARDPSSSSWYIDDAYYERLVADFSNWQREERVIADPVERDRFRQLLEREARLLDERRFDVWLALFARECAYWVPGTPGGGDPRREIAVCFDDRRRMEDRVHRLGSPYAWSQVPASRTVRLVTNVEVFATAQSAVRMVRSNLLIVEFRAGETRQLAGWCGHRIALRDDRCEIEVRQVNLVDADQCLRNPSLIL